MVDGNDPPKSSSISPRNGKGWDGKLRVNKKAVITNPEALTDSEYSDEYAPPVDQIEADEDLLDDHPPDIDDINLVHCGISSIQALHLERFAWVQKLCLRQNRISDIELPQCLSLNLKDLDLYDNLISHIKGLDGFQQLTSLDLSFNKIKHIRHVNHLVELKDLYFVQNKIERIEGLNGMLQLRNLELAANRIRKIENVDTLTGLEELWLGKNKITELNNLSSLTNLKILSIPSNRLTQISDLSSLVNLEELYISHNAITSLSDLDHNVKLHVLDISNNQITNLTGLKTLTHLEELWASSNELSSFDEVESELADKQELNTVYFEGNPLQRKNPVMYRNKVKLALPQVRQIDATYVR